MCARGAVNKLLSTRVLSVWAVGHFSSCNLVHADEQEICVNSSIYWLQSLGYCGFTAVLYTSTICYICLGMFVYSLIVLFCPHVVSLNVLLLKVVRVSACFSSSLHNFTSLHMVIHAAVRDDGWGSLRDVVRTCPCFMEHTVLCTAPLQ